nr:hypothetical protein [Tanacetum cinerariifolium]
MIDLDLLTKDIKGFKTYEEFKDDWTYTWKNNVPWREDGYCNGRNLPGAYIIGNSLHYQDYEGYETLEDRELNKEALRYKAIIEGTIDDDDEQEICSNEAHELPVCNIRRFKMIKYSFRDDEEYVAVKEDEYNVLQFWATAKSRTVNDVKKIHAKVNGKIVVISESSVRSDLQFNDEDGEDDRVVRAATTTASLEAKQESGSIHKTQPTTTLNEPSPQGTSSCSEPRVLALKQFKTTQDLVIKMLQKKVKRLEKEQRARTPGMKLFKIGTSKKKTLDKDNDVNAAQPVSTDGDAVNAASVIRDVSVFGPSTSSFGPSTSTAEDIFEDEMTTMADTLMAIRRTRPRTTSVVIHDVKKNQGEQHHHQ